LCSLRRSPPSCRSYGKQISGGRYLRFQTNASAFILERKARLKRLLRRNRSRILYVDHIEKHGQRLFEKVCELDLEGIVAKRKDSLYRATEKRSPYWIKIKNRYYTQSERREELFDPRRTKADKVECSLPYSVY
jgi:hypothetical protein